MALAMVLVMGLLLSTTVTVLLRAAELHYEGVESQRRRGTAFYASEAGVQMAWYKLTRKIAPFNDQSVAGWPVNTPKTDAVTLLVDDPDPAKRRTVAITVTRLSTAPGPRQFQIQAATELPGTGP